MQLGVIRADDEMTELALVGKLDIAGVHAIDMKFHLNTATRRKPTLVDLSQFESIGSATGRDGRAFRNRHRWRLGHASEMRVAAQKRADKHASAQRR